MHCREAASGKFSSIRGGGFLINIFSNIVTGLLTIRKSKVGTTVLVTHSFNAVIRSNLKKFENASLKLSVFSINFLPSRHSTTTLVP